MSDSFNARLATLSPQQLQLLALDLRDRLDRAQSEREPIAVVGIGCRFPGADGPDALWRLVSSGGDAIRDVPIERWNAAEYFDPDPDAPGRMATRWGGFIDGIDQFDPEFFGISPREAHALDPQHRLLLEVAWEALEHAGIAPESLRGSSSGVFVGIGSTDYLHLCAARGDDAIDTYLASGASPSVASGRVSYVLGLEGPTYSIDTACSSSLMAVHTAVRSLRARECRLALAAGVNALLWPTGTIALSRGRMMAADGRCKTFDARGDGFVRAEGCGVVVLKRLSDALADGDRVLAVLRGSAANHDGRSNGLTAPNGRAQAAVIASALADAGVDPSAVSYVEAHGTGTSLGDPIEVHAIGAALGPGRAPDDRVYVASVKTNIGHLEAAAGIAGLIKTILMLQHRQIPASLHFVEPNPFIDWARLPVTVPTALTPWNPALGQKRRIAGVSSFGLSGSNAHIIVEEAEDVEAPVATRPPRAIQLLPLSARSETALRELAARYARALDTEANVSLADAAFTAGAGRAHFERRAAVIATTRDDAVAQLRSLADGRSDGAAVQGPVQPTGSPKIAFLYTGQGAQYAGMTAALSRSEPVFRQALERCAAVVDPLMNASLVDLLHAAAEGDRRIHETRFTQPALVAVEFALTELWRSWGIVPAAVIGHSIGEFAAACAAGVMTIEDALSLAVTRGRLMQSAPGEGAMVAVMAPRERVASDLAAHADLSIAAFNGPESIVVSGTRASVEVLSASLKSKGIDVRRLETSHAFHSALMDPVLDEFERAAASVVLREPGIVLVSNLTGAAAGAEITTPAYWRRHIREAVRFADGMSYLTSIGARLFVEIGPHPALIAMARRYVAGDGLQWLPSLRRDRDDAEQITETLGALYVHGASIDWKSYGAGRGARRVALPTYPFERESYWFDRVDAGTPSTMRKPASPAVRATEPSAHADWLYEVRWARADRPAADVRCAGETWLLVGGPEGLRTALAARLTAVGARALSLTLAPDEGEASGEIERRLSDDLDAHARDTVFARVVYLEGVGGAVDADMGFAARAHRVHRGALALARAIAARDWNTKLWFVTAGASSAARVSDVAASGLAGFARAIALEHPTLWGGIVDLDRSSDATRAHAVLGEVASPDAESVVAVVGGHRFVARLEAATTFAGDGPNPGLRADRTYVVTGGFGGIGRHLVAWLVARGVRHIACVVRRAPTDADNVALDASRAAGADVRVVHGDVADAQQLESALATVRKSMPAIAGVFHAAGAADSALIERLDWPEFAHVIAAKANGAWNLHVLTREDPLDHFVLFSSGASLFGAIGIAAYAAANAMLDGLAHHRRADGLPALAVNWGSWENTGMHAAMQSSVRSTWTHGGLSPMAPADALDLLGRALTPAAPAQLAAVDMDWAAFASTAPARSSLFADLIAAPAAAPASAAPGSTTTLDPLELSKLAPADGVERLTAFLREQLSRELGLAPERIAPTRTLNALGLDSLMAVQLRNRLQQALQVTVPVSRFIEGINLNELAADVFERVLRAQAPSHEAPGGASQSAGVSIRDAVLPAATSEQAVEVGSMSDDEVERMLRELLDGGHAA